MIRIMIKLTDYPKFMSHWMYNNDSIIVTLRNTCKTANPISTVFAENAWRFMISEEEHTWFIVRWA